MPLLTKLFEGRTLNVTDSLKKRKVGMAIARKMTPETNVKNVSSTDFENKTKQTIN